MACIRQYPTCSRGYQQQLQAYQQINSSRVAIYRVQTLVDYSTVQVIQISSSLSSSIIISFYFYSYKGLFIPMLAIIGQCFVTCEQPFIGVLLLSIGVGFQALVVSGGLIVNINEVGGNYSGILYGISNTFATLPGIIAPYLVGLITTSVSY